jgi:hypothetical protein
VGTCSSSTSVQGSESVQPRTTARESLPTGLTPRLGLVLRIGFSPDVSPTVALHSRASATCEPCDWGVVRTTSFTN